MILKIDEEISLELINEDHAEQLFEMVDSNRQHLKEWLPWVDSMVSVESFNNHISFCKKKEAEGTDYAFIIMFNNNMAGRIGIHYIDAANRIASIGYWMGEGFQGKGIMTRSCTAIVDHCFHVLDMNRVQIKAATGNKKSRAIAEKLNFKNEGTLRQAELVNEKFLDIVLYAMLKEEWESR
jgi:ribosomal-protein-serine acetyltransferase